MRQKRQEEVRARPAYSILALLSFMASFGVARIFTTLNPDMVLIGGGLHIHHFWYGLALLCVGGWIGISYDDDRTNRFAAVLFGAGGGLVGDEIGLLLTLGDYWTGATYSSVILIVGVSSVLILMSHYFDDLGKGLFEFVHSPSSFYFGVSLLIVSAVFIVESRTPLIMMLSAVLALVSGVLVTAYFLHRRTGS